jgi:uncharacterized membrane protein YedE/YeeE
LAERSAFCFRRALVGVDRAEAAGLWAAALAVAVGLTQAAVAAGWVSFEGNRFLAVDLPLASILAGGLLFGAGMILARGCISRHAVLAATGNTRAAMTLLVLAVIAHATMKGVLSPLREGIGSLTVDLGSHATLAALPGGAGFWAALLAVALAAAALRSGAGATRLVMGALIGALVPLAWIGGTILAADPFEPVAAQGLSYAGPSADALFWVIAASAIPAGFGAGLIGGTLGGAFLSGAFGRRLRLQSFSTGPETARYAAGAVLMGFGGVLAGGCTIGAGLSGMPTLSLAAILAIAAIAAGGLATHAVLEGRRGPVRAARG